MKKIARNLSKSPLFANARHLLDLNRRDENYPLTKWQKCLVGSYMVLQDYSEGVFPPKHKEEQATFDAENACFDTPGRTSPQERRLGSMQKPFWHGPACAKYLRDYIDIQTSMHKLGVRPPASLLEVGCGSGWMAEFLTNSGFKVLATTLDGEDVKQVRLRRQSLKTKGMHAALDFRQSPMEYVYENVRDMPPFDGVYVYEALHHAHDWKKAIKSFYDALAPNGWCFICSEPNVMHTLVSYRVGRLTNTHEIGIVPAHLRKHLKDVGFTKVLLLKNRIHWWIKPIWIAAQKGITGSGVSIG